jgi:dephospho-CoA kinase
MSDKIIIGLTGNIATGKSLVLRMLQELGATVIDADKLVHRLMRPGGSVYNAIVEEFGKFVLDQNRQISRATLGKIVFSDPTALSRLEGLTHPAVIAEIQRQVGNAPTPVVAVEAIKLFESGIADKCTVTWVVVAPPEVQYRRLLERRRMKPDQAKQRIKAQGSQQPKAAKANLVIDNSGPLAKTWGTVKMNYQKLLHTTKAAPPPKASSTPLVKPVQPTTEPVLPSAIKPEDVVLRRAKRDNLQDMAELIYTGTKGALKPDISDMMELLFSRAYLVAVVGDKAIGMIGWQTENLVAGVQDFYVLRDNMWDTVGKLILEKVHEEIDKLSCEVALLFVLNEAGQQPIEFLEKQNYEQFDGKKLIQDWREAAVEWQPDNSVLLYKKIREQRIMVPM